MIGKGCRSRKMQKKSEIERERSERPEHREKGVGGVEKGTRVE